MAARRAGGGGRHGVGSSANGRTDDIFDTTKTEEFVAWASRNGKSFGSTREFESRLGTW